LELGAEYSMELGKQTYGGMRRWLLEDQWYRSVEFVQHFNGEVESRPKPKAISVEEQQQRAAEYEAWRAASNTPGVVGDPSKIHDVKRASILYRLPYWKVCKFCISCNERTLLEMEQ
jgi:hypothetical protein